MSARRPALLVPVVVPFLLAVLLFLPATLGGKVLSASDLPRFAAPFLDQPAGAVPQNPLQFDAANVFEPDGLLVRRALREGRLPLWAPALSAGRPLLAAQQSAPLFPLTWLGVVGPFWETLAWIAVLELTLAALGTFLFAQSLGLSRGASLLGALTFGFGTYLIVWLMHPHAHAYVLLPWAFLASERLCRRGRVGDGAWLALVLGLAWLGGQPEAALLVTLAASGWTVSRLVGLERSLALRRGALAVAGLGVGLALSAVMLVPLLEALGVSLSTSRAGAPLPVKAALSVVFPEYWFRPGRPGGMAGPANFTERTLYVGVLPLLLAAGGLAAGGRPRGPKLFFAALAAVALLIAFDTGPVAALAAKLPGLDRINLSRCLALASFAIALLAAYGFEGLCGEASQRRRVLAVAAVLAVLPVLGVFAAHPGWLTVLPDGARRLLGNDTVGGADPIAVAAVLRWTVFAGVGLILLGLMVRGRARGTPAVAVACALVALDLITMGWDYNPAIDKGQAVPATLPPPLVEMRRLVAGGGRVVGIDALEPNTAPRWGLRDVRGHEQPTVRRTATLWSALGGSASVSTEAVSPSSPRTPALLDVFGARAVVLAPGTQSSLGADRTAYSGPDGIVLDHRSALPEAFVAYRWRRSRSLRQSVLLTALGGPGAAQAAPAIETTEAPPAGESRPPTSARILSRSDTVVRVAVRAAAPGRLVLLDTFYPGWTAEVDGRKTTIEAADAAFRAVAVPAGRHEVRFTYRPASVLIGGVLSLLALVTIVGTLVVDRRRARAG